jgi:hypothetical protein
MARSILLIAVYLTTVAGGVVCDAELPDLPAQSQLSASIAAYDEAVKKLKEEVLREFANERERLLDAKVNIEDKVSSLERLEEDKRAFEENGRIPVRGAFKSLAKRSQATLAASKAQVVDAFDKAAESYGRTDLAAAKQILAQKADFLRPSQTKSSLRSKSGPVGATSGPDLTERRGPGEAPEVKEPRLGPELLRPTNQLKAWQSHFAGTGKGAIASDPESIIFECTTSDSIDHHCQFNQSVTSIVEDAEYLLAFEAKGEVPRKFKMHVQIAVPDYHSLGFRRTVDVTDEFQRHEYTFTARSVNSNPCRISVDLGDREGRLFMKNLSLRQKQSSDSRDVP